VVLGIGEALGVPAFNALYGNRVETASAAEQDELATENLTLAAKAAAGIGATVLVEPVSGPKPYPLRTAEDVVSVLDRVGAANLGFLCDLFHLVNNGDDVDMAVAAYGNRIAHVQIADHPGRHQPGTGTLDLDRLLVQIERGGYAGRVGLEYVPSGSTLDSLAWLPIERRGLTRHQS
jgi:hydroxypyruvate isomerase